MCLAGSKPSGTLVSRTWIVSPTWYLVQGSRFRGLLINLYAKGWIDGWMDGWMLRRVEIRKETVRGEDDKMIEGWGTDTWNRGTAPDPPGPWPAAHLFPLFPPTLG